MTAFLQHPGRSGPFGALMDEYARAAEEFCRVAETFVPERFEAIRPSDNPETASPRAICRHVCGAANRYAHYIRRARGLSFIDRFQLEPALLTAPSDTRARLAEAVQLTEVTVEPFLTVTDEQIQAVSFVVRWGPRYNPEMLLEHAVCHVLRHRRQLERW